MPGLGPRGPVGLLLPLRLPLGGVPPAVGPACLAIGPIGASALLLKDGLGSPDERDRLR